MHNISRRTLLRTAGTVAAATTFGGTLAACGGTGARSGGGDLTMTWWGSDQRHVGYQKALAAFTKKNPEIKIKSRYSGFDGYFDKFNTQVSGGSAPDLLQMDRALVAVYAKKGVLAPLDEYVGKSLDLSGFSESLLESGTVDGKLYGVPSGIGVNVVTLNVTGLKRLGIAEPDKEWTWEELKTYASGIYKASGGRTFGVDDGGGSTNQAFEIFAREKGQTLYTSDGKLGHTKETLEEWWTYWAEMRKIRASPGGAVTSSAHNDLTKNAVVIGKAMITFDSGLNSSGGTITGATLDFVPTPHGSWRGAREGNYVNGGVLLSATKRSSHIADSAKVMAYFAQDATAIKEMALLRGIPPTARAREIVAPSMSANDKRAAYAATYLSDRVGKASNVLPAPVAPPAGADQITELLFQSNLAIAFGKKTIKAALSEYFDEAESILSA